MTEEEDTQGIVTISGKSAEEGPTRRLLNAQMDLMTNLGLDDERNTAERWPLIMILMVEGLLLLGTVARLLCLHLGGKLASISVSSLVEAFATGYQKGEHETLVTLHVVTTSLGQILLLPQLYMLVILSKESLTVFLQLALAVLLVCLTVATQALQTGLGGDEGEASCVEKGSCLHKAWAWLLTINIFLFLAIIMVRVLFHLRFRDWVTSLRVVGPLLEFVVSRKCREFQALMLVIGLSGTALSGMVISTHSNMATKLKDLDSRDLTWGEDGFGIIMDTLSYLLTTFGLLVLVMQYLYSHYMHTHTVMLDKEQLEQELISLAQKHEEVLVADQVPSKLRYCPVTRTCRPVDSEQSIVPKSRYN